MLGTYFVFIIFIFKETKMKILPDKRPQMTKQEVLDLVLVTHPDYKIPDIFWVGIRGYYKKTMGNPDGNDRAMYDDALFIVSKGEFVSFNGNCDPRRFTKGIASLKAGIWPVYKFDRHKDQYIALCQRGGKVTVVRDEKGEDTGMFGINIHRGGSYGTSSAGCQTIPPSQWEDFIGTSMRLARKYDVKNWDTGIYTYILIENK